MITFIAFVVGFVWGWRSAVKKGGGTADKWQYAIGHAVGFALAAFIVTLILLHLGLMPPTPY